MNYRFKWDSLYLFVGLIYITGTFLALELSHKHFFLNDDNAEEFLPLLIHIYDCLATTGELDQINYYQFGGEPVIEQGLPGVFYPPYYLAGYLARTLTHDAKWTLEWSIFLHWIASLVIFYYWLKSYGVREYICLLGSINWVCAPFYIVIGCSWETLSIIQCIIPGTFLFSKQLLNKCSIWSILGLSLSISTFILVGTIQYLVYLLPLLLMYLLNSGFELNRLKGFIYAAVVTLIISLPQYLPMSHASDNAILRSSSVFTLADKLQWYLDPPDFILTQVFCYGIVHTAMSLCFLSLELYLFFPLLNEFKNLELKQGAPIRLLIWISMIAFLFCTVAHGILFMLPIFGMFRWPFKVFTLFKFFILSATFLLANSYITRKALDTPRRLLLFALILIPLVNVICIARSARTICLSDSRIDEGKQLGYFHLIDTQKGRVMGVGKPDDLADFEYYLYLLYSTYYKIPNIGGYDPLVTKDNFFYAFGILNQGCLMVPVSQLPRESINEKSIRYWLIDPKVPIGVQSIELPDTKILYQDSNVVLVENLESFPMVSDENHREAGVFHYYGNTMSCLLTESTNRVYISLASNDGWWYRVDNGPWKRPDYGENRICCDVTGSRKNWSNLEIKYFDPRVQTGYYISLVLYILLVAASVIEYRFLSNKKTEKPTLRPQSN